MQALRKEYRLQSLLEKDVDVNPINNLKTGGSEAIESAIEEAQRHDTLLPVALQVNLLHG